LFVSVCIARCFNVFFLYCMCVFMCFFLSFLGNTLSVQSMYPFLLDKIDNKIKFPREAIKYTCWWCKMQETIFPASYISSMYTLQLPGNLIAINYKTCQVGPHSSLNILLMQFQAAKVKKHPRVLQWVFKMPGHKVVVAAGTKRAVFFQCCK